jgi:hypothetical protein
MTQQYPPQPGHAYYQPQPQQPAPQPPKKKRKWPLVLGGAAVLLVIGIAASSNGSKGGTDDTASPARPTLAASGKAAAKKPAAPAAQSPAQEFKAYVQAHGTATEKAAAAHITKVQGADSKNDILDAADIYTDYTGGMMGPHQSDGKLIASAFADWESSRGKDSANGLVTIYDKTGQILSNGNY